MLSWIGSPLPGRNVTEAVPRHQVPALSQRKRKCVACRRKRTGSIAAGKVPQACAVPEKSQVPHTPHKSVSELQSITSTLNRTQEMSTSAVDDKLLSPMMQHYVATKRQVLENLGGASNRSLILMYRVGDFFESFFEDAFTLSRVCEIALTSKDAGKALGNRAPMAGVPHYCIDEKIKVLLSHNVAVAVVDQIQSAAEAPSGKLVERAVTRLITPGTASDDTLLEANESSYLASLVIRPSSRHRDAQVSPQKNGTALRTLCFGFAYADVSTGEFRATESHGIDVLRRLLFTISPAELLFIDNAGASQESSDVEEEIRVAGVDVISRRQPLPLEAAERVVANFHKVDSVESLDCRGRPLCTEAAAAVLTFLDKTVSLGLSQETLLPLNRLATFSTSDVMLLDSACIRNLEVLETKRDGMKDRSLQWAVDRTITAMGGRCLRSWLVSPPTCLRAIRARQLVVEAFVNNFDGVRSRVQGMLKSVADLERLGGRLCSGRASPRELRWLCESILRLPPIFDCVRDCVHQECNGKLQDELSLSWLTPVQSNIIALAGKVLDALVDPAPSTLVTELAVHAGGVAKQNLNLSSTQIFKSGYNEKLDGLRQAIDEPGSWLQLLEKREKKRTTVDALRIKHIKNMGYVLRIPRSAGERKMDEDPMYFAKLGYDRVQSTKAELRFRSEELRVKEKSHFSAFSEVVLLELRLFEELRLELSHHVQYLRKLGQQVAAVDVLAGFSQVAEEQHYVKPDLLDASEPTLDLVDARHPVVEQALPVGRTFVPNTIRLGSSTQADIPDLMVLCGPNAAGKSCALRSVGLITILAQVGSFVPARAARLSLCDRIFTRVGAVDDLARGQSTFQVEMAETACILSHATASSLVLLDEIGRGTSSVDGIAIAWSVSEFLAKPSPNGVYPPRSMFVTHYHELNHLPSIHDNVKAFHLHMERRQSCNNGNGVHQDGWIPTYKVVPGPSFESLGLTIARRAGFPAAVLERADEVADILRSPCEALGAELQSALHSTPVADTPRREQNDGYKKGEQDGNSHRRAKEAYDEGFAAGYKVALAKVEADFEDMMALLRSRG